MSGNHLSGFRRSHRARPVIVTIDGQRVESPRSYARLADCEGFLWSRYQAAKTTWDRARQEPDSAREQIRIDAIEAFNAWARSCGAEPIATPDVWGFN